MNPISIAELTKLEQSRNLIKRVFNGTISICDVQEVMHYSAPMKCEPAGNYWAFILLTKDEGLKFISACGMQGENYGKITITHVKFHRYKSDFLTELHRCAVLRTYFCMERSPYETNG